MIVQFLKFFEITEFYSHVSDNLFVSVFFLLFFFFPIYVMYVVNLNEITKGRPLAKSLLVGWSYIVKFAGFQSLFILFYTGDISINFFYALVGTFLVCGIFSYFGIYFLFFVHCYDYFSKKK